MTEIYLHIVARMVTAGAIFPFSWLLRTDSETIGPRLVVTGAWAIGSAVKLDPVVQDNALDAAVMPALIKLLSSGADASGPSRSASTRTKAIFALGHLLRSNRRAQRLFATHDGPRLLLAELRPDGGAAEQRPTIGLTKKILVLRSVSI